MVVVIQSLIYIFYIYVIFFIYVIFLMRETPDRALLKSDLERGWGLNLRVRSLRHESYTWETFLVL